MTEPNTLAVALLRDVPRINGDRHFLVSDVLTALTAALDPAIAERAERISTECLQAAEVMQDTNTFPTGQAIFLDASDLITALLAQNAALRAERDELAAAIDSIETSHGLTSNGNLWRFFARKACDIADKAASDRKAAEAQATALTAQVERLTGTLRWAHDTLWEINPNNYDHDEVCKLNDASVEVILGIAPLIGETHGKSPEWWAARAAMSTTEEGHE